MHVFNTPRVEKYMSLCVIVLEITGEKYILSFEIFTNLKTIKYLLRSVIIIWDRLEKLIILL